MGASAWVAAAAMVLLAQVAPSRAPRDHKEIVVDWDEGLVYPLDDGRPAHRTLITNTGAQFKEKYLGTFRTTQKLLEHRSSMYNEDVQPIRPGQLGARMPYWMRIGWTDQGFHCSGSWDPKGSRRRSKGCYRLSLDDARWLFHWTPIGTPVHVLSSVCGTRYAFLVPKRCRLEAARRASAGAAGQQRKRPGV